MILVDRNVVANSLQELCNFALKHDLGKEASDTSGDAFDLCSSASLADFLQHPAEARVEQLNSLPDQAVEELNYASVLDPVLCAPKAAKAPLAVDITTKDTSHKR